jgi:hypothetical protein
MSLSLKRAFPVSFSSFAKALHVFTIALGTDVAVGLTIEGTLSHMGIDVKWLNFDFDTGPSD